MGTYAWILAVNGIQLVYGGSKADHRLQQSWKDLSYTELALQIFSLYISRSEIPADDLKAIIDRSYSTFREKEVTPLVQLQGDKLYLLELFHGPSYSFKDCALQFLGNLFEYLLARKNEGKQGKGASRRRLARRNAFKRPWPRRWKLTSLQTDII